ncbi:MAG: hypothetical protein AB7K04_05615 [Pseudorhodoplanes sp.]
MKTFFGALAFAMACFAATTATAQMTASGKPCEQEFMSLQKEREKHGRALQEAQSKKQLDRSQACGMLKTYLAVETKLLKFMQDNNVWCGVPAQATEQMKTIRANTVKTTNQVCSAAAAPSAPPPPSLSDVLGTTRVPDSSTTRSGRGTLDSLTGNPLKR